MENYPKDWVNVNLMINKETGEIHAIGGDQEPGKDDAPYIGLEMIRNRIEGNNEKKNDEKEIVYVEPQKGSFSKIWDIIKLIVIIVLFAGLAAGGVQAYNWIQNKFEADADKLEALMEEQRRYQKIQAERDGKIVDLINQVRAKTEVVTTGSDAWKDELDKLRKENSEMLELIKKNNEKIQNVGEVSAQANENASLALNKASDNEYKPDTGDPNEQYFKKITMKEKNDKGEEVEVAVGWAIFYPNRPSGERWKTGIYPIEFKSKIIQAEQKDGQWNTYADLWLENNKDNESEGKKLPLDVQIAEFKQVLKKNKEFFVWNPRINLNADVGFGTGGEAIGAGLSVSFMGYGKTKRDQTWQFIDLGVSTNGEDTWFRFSPFKYNLGEHIPLVENTFIAPFAGVDTEGNFLGGVGISIPF